MECILHTLRLEPGALLTLGPPCGSFVWLNLATSGRSEESPFGNEDRAYVELASLTLVSMLIPKVNSKTIDAWDHTGNDKMIKTYQNHELRICSRALLLVALATCRGVYFALEQPNSSTMKFFPDLLLLGKNIKKLLNCWYVQYLPGAQCCIPTHLNSFNLHKCTYAGFSWVQWGLMGLWRWSHQSCGVQRWNLSFLPGRMKPENIN